MLVAYPVTLHILWEVHFKAHLQLQYEHRCLTLEGFFCHITIDLRDWKGFHQKLIYFLSEL